MNAGQALFFCLIFLFLFLLTMNTDVHDGDTTSEIVDKTPAPAAASGKFRSLFFGCFDKTRGNTVVTRYFFIDIGLLDLPDEIVLKILQYLPLSSVIQSLSSHASEYSSYPILLCYGNVLHYRIQGVLLSTRGIVLKAYLRGTVNVSIIYILTASSKKILSCGLLIVMLHEL